ncbi:LIM domain transcription factor [Dirofilaria immitis]
MDGHHCAIKLFLRNDYIFLYNNYFTNLRDGEMLKITSIFLEMQYSEKLLSCFKSSTSEFKCMLGLPLGINRKSLTHSQNVMICKHL